MKFGIGQSVRRTEDNRFVTGRGQYTEDLPFENAAQVAFLRSPYAHARITSIDTSAAETAPGVIAVLTWKEVEAAGAKPMPCLAPLKNRDGSPIKQTPKPLLAKDHVTFTGEAIAMVVAETYPQAVDAAELVQVEYDSLDAVGTLAAAPEGPQIWSDALGNECFDWSAGNEEACNAAFAKAAQTASVEVVQNRVAPSSMETRNAIGLYDAASDSYTLYSGNQGSGGLRDRVCGVLNLDKSKLRVITKDVGGGFGMKGFMYPEQPLVLIAAKQLKRPVRWISTRTEAFLSDDHGRDAITKGELALDADGRILGLRITGSANMGGYLSQFAPFIATMAGGRIFGGLYRVPTVYTRIKGYFSNSGPIDAYRGAGRPEAAYLIEWLMDVAARETGIDRVELRRRNLIQADELPYQNWFGVKYDSGEYPRMLDTALQRADVAGFPERREQSKARGKLRGLGIAYYVEITFAVGSEPARVAFTDNGGVECYVGTQSNGQGHETTFPQLAAALFGIAPDRLSFRQADTGGCCRY